MPRLGVLSVTLVANTGRFRRDMKQSKSLVQSMTGTLNITKRAVVGLGAAFLGFRSASGAIDKVVEAFSRLEELARTSDRLGIPVEDMQVLQEAARRTNIPINTLNLGLQRFVRRVGQAAIGTGEAVDALFELGLGAGRLAKSNPADAFVEVIDKLGSLQNAFERTRLAQKLFDSEGVRLVDLASMGSEGLAQLQQEMIKSGQVLSKSMTDNILEANEAFAKFAASGRALIDVLAVKLSPVIVKVSNAINELAQAMRFADISVPAAISGALSAGERVTSGFGTVPNPVSRSFDKTAREFEVLSIMRMNNELARQQLEAIQQLNTGAQ